MAGRSLRNRRLIRASISRGYMVKYWHQLKGGIPMNQMTLTDMAYS